MTYTTEPVSTRFFSSFASNPNAIGTVADVTAAFKALSVDDQLATLWYIYTEMGRSITPAAPGAARLQFAEGLLNQIKQMSPAEQLQAQRDIANSANTDVSRAYGLLTANTKLAFWYQLAEWMATGVVIPMPAGYEMSAATATVFQQVKQLDMGQQITVLRNAVINMGIDPLAD